MNMFIDHDYHKCVSTRIVFICSFFIAFDCPKNFLLNHCRKYISDFGVGMMLNGGGAVAPSSKKLFSDTNEMGKRKS
jgi:hypothetical protein